MKEVKIQFKDLLLNTGRCPIKFGMSPEEVEAILGKSREWLQASEGILIGVYGWYTFTFLDFLPGHEGVYFLYQVHNDTLKENDWLSFDHPHIQVDPWILQQGMTKPELIDELNRLGIAFKEKSSFDVDFIEVGQKASIGFSNYDDETDPEPTLYCITSESPE